MAKLSRTEQQRIKPVTQQTRNNLAATYAAMRCQVCGDQFETFRQKRVHVCLVGTDVVELCPPVTPDEIEGSV